MSFEVYTRMVDSSQVPNFVGAIKRDGFISFNINLAELNDILITKTQVFGKGFKWTLKATAYAGLDPISLTCVYWAANDGIGLRACDGMQIEDRVNGKLYSYRFDDSGKKIGMNSMTIPATSPHKLPEADGPTPKPVKRGVASVKLRDNRWTCSCQFADETWCPHVEDFFEEGKDRFSFANPVGVTRSRGKVNLIYPIAYGVIDLVITVEHIVDLGKDHLGRDIPSMIRLSTILGEDEISIWMQDEDAGITLIRQVYDLVKGHRRWSVWEDLARTGVPLKFKCRNPRHTSKDSQTLNLLLERTRGASDLAVQAFVFANTYEEMCNQRCCVCATFLQNMKDDDIPRM